MAQLFGSRLARLAVRASAAVGVAGLTVAVSSTPAGADPAAASTTPYVYVANCCSENVSVIKTSTNTVVKTVTVGLYPAGIAITPNGNDAYVTDDSAPGTVSVIDTATNKVVKTVNVGSGPYGVAIT
jgi:YVTN family beta-propeller protein